MSQRQHVRIDYHLRPDADLEAYLAEVARFVANIGKFNASNEYTTYRDAKDPRHFVHVGHFDADVSEPMQTEAWFKTFTAHLRTQSVAPPDVVMLAVVASTRT